VAERQAELGVRYGELLGDLLLAGGEEVVDRPAAALPVRGGQDGPQGVCVRQVVPVAGQPGEGIGGRLDAAP
jgi:hypothetical protein